MGEGEREESRMEERDGRSGGRERGGGEEG